MQALIIFFAEYFGYILLAFLIFLFLKKRSRLLFVQLAAAAILSRGIITEAIRLLWDRGRPFAENGFAPLVDHPASPSFPSGHAALFFAIAGVVYAHNQKLGLLFFAGALLIGIARVLAGLHYGSDIAGGAAVGITSAFLMVQLSKRIWKNASSS
ncbi:MAG: phosphatase PAP2 family protein [Candidatus Wildermuthbacteria bacterium]|nr:phosphatase PAP2 family protein [Candidatus Wildermuthbacteria bacterium]